MKNLSSHDVCIVKEGSKIFLNKSLTFKPDVVTEKTVDYDVEDSPIKVQSKVLHEVIQAKLQTILDDIQNQRKETKFLVDNDVAIALAQIVKQNSHIFTYDPFDPSFKIEHGTMTVSYLTNYRN